MKNLGNYLITLLIIIAVVCIVDMILDVWVKI